MEKSLMEIHTGDAAGKIAEAEKRYIDERVAKRIREKDHTLWSDSPEEIRDRLGWLEIPERAETLDSFREGLSRDGIDRVLLLGMGGSSLAPELFAEVFPGSGGLALSVLDSVIPAEILKKERAHDPARTLYVVSSKSGTTVEVDTLMKHFFRKAAETLGEDEAGKRFIAITNPGTALVNTARALKFREVFLYRPDVGGRYAALTPVGLIPAALIGMDLRRLLKSAAKEAGADLGDILSPAAALGTALGGCALAGRNKLTLLSDERTAPFLDWLEQLVAESTGKDGKGIVPVIGEKVAEVSRYGKDRVFVRFTLEGKRIFDDELKALETAGHPVVTINLRDRYDLGGQFFLWEYATAVACWLLGVHPFNQPDVEAAKKFARATLAEYKKLGKSGEGEPSLSDGSASVYGEAGGKDSSEALLNFARKTRPGGYMVVQAYLPRSPELNAAMATLREFLWKTSGAPVTLGYGPRFLHSTGQLHKGGPAGGLFIQLCGEDREDMEIPGEGVTFGALKAAQYLGDFQALKKSGREAIRLNLKGDPAETILRLTGR